MFGLGKLWGYLVAAGAALVAVVGAVGLIRRDAVKDERRRAKEEDYEHADDIRGRVERDLPDRVRDFDGSGWRD